MASEKFLATAEISIEAPVSKVWEALVTPAIIKQYMFGTEVNSAWTEGSSITWKGAWEGKSYEDKGEILEITPNERLQYTHFSPLTGEKDLPENYHTVTIGLTPLGEETHIRLTQDKNDTEKSKEHSEKNWSMMLASLKKLLENKK